MERPIDAHKMHAGDRADQPGRTSVAALVTIALPEGSTLCLPLCRNIEAMAAQASAQQRAASEAERSLLARLKQAERAAATAVAAQQLAQSQAAAAESALTASRSAAAEAAAVVRGLTAELDAAQQHGAGLKVRGRTGALESGPAVLNSVTFDAETVWGTTRLRFWKQSPCLPGNALDVHVVIVTLILQRLQAELSRTLQQHRAALQQLEQQQDQFEAAQAQLERKLDAAQEMVSMIWHLRAIVQQKISALECAVQSLQAEASCRVGIVSGVWYL